MIAALLSWLTGRVPALLLGALLAAALAWQSVRIEGLPLLGGGLKAQVAALEKDIAGRDLADARAQAALLAARAAQAAQGQAQAQRHALARADAQAQIETVIREVPRHVTPTSDAACVVPWGAVRLLDAAASGADPAYAAAHIAPGQSDDAASDVSLSEAVALLAADLGIARQNAGQLSYLEEAVRP